MPSDPRTSAPSRRGLRIAGIAGLLVAAAIVVAGLVTRANGKAELRRWTDAQAIPTVAVVTPESGGAGLPLELPGRLEAWSRAPLYARVSGYLKDWKVDIGAKVRAGQLLAEIETPDLDQQLLQARADLASAKANAALAKTTADRWRSMLGSDSVSRQEVDEKVGDLTAKDAMVKAAQANVDRIAALKGFTRITAPFAGVVTARDTDVGALINAGGGSGQELFVVSDTSKLRVYVNVPQSYVPDVTAGTKATIRVPEHPDRTYQATVASSAGAVDAASGTTLMQLAVDNANGELLPGGYAEVSLTPRSRTQSIRIPSSALMFDRNGLRVAVVGSDDKVALKTVTIRRDLGPSIELASGIEAGARVIDSPPDGLADGDRVRVAEATPKTDAIAAKPSSAAKSEHAPD